VATSLFEQVDVPSAQVTTGPTPSGSSRAVPVGPTGDSPTENEPSADFTLLDSVVEIGNEISEEGEEESVVDAECAGSDCEVLDSMRVVGRLLSDTETVTLGATEAVTGSTPTGSSEDELSEDDVLLVVVV
jgi:hypothetical protein